MELRVTDVSAKYKSTPRTSHVDNHHRSGSTSLRSQPSKADQRAPMAIGGGFSLQTALKGFSKNIGEYIQKREYQNYAQEVNEFMTKHLPASSKAEHDAYRAIFLNQFDFGINLPVPLLDERCSNVSADSPHLVFWSDRNVCLISLFKQDVVLDLSDLPEFLAAYISPDSSILVVLQRSNYLAYSIQTGKLVFDYNKRKDEAKNPFESDANHETVQLNIGKIRCSVMRNSKKSPTQTGETDEEVIDCFRYQLIFGDRESHYLIDFKLSDNTGDFSII